jgi:hypothetical protein
MRLRLLVEPRAHAAVAGFLGYADPDTGSSFDRRVMDKKGFSATDETTTSLGHEHQEPRPPWLSIDPVLDPRFREDEGGLRLTQNVPHPRGVGRLVRPNQHRLSTTNATPPNRLPGARRRASTSVVKLGGVGMASSPWIVSDGL